MSIVSGFVEWTPSSVMNFIESCRNDEGIPIFKTKFAGVPIWSVNGRGVLGICWAGKGKAPDSVVFTNVPDDIYEEIERKKGDWRFLTVKYEGLEKLKELLEKPVRLYTKRWSAIPKELFEVD